jgi:hypothetical protein
MKSVQHIINLAVELPQLLLFSRPVVVGIQVQKATRLQSVFICTCEPEFMYVLGA